GGETHSGSSFPIASPPSAAFTTGFAPHDDAWVAKLNAAGDGLLYSFLMAGDSPDIVWGITVSGSSAYVCGMTCSPAFPVTPGAFETPPPNGDFQGFVAKFTDNPVTGTGGPGTSTCGAFVSGKGSVKLARNHNASFNFA